LLAHGIDSRWLAAWSSVHLRTPVEHPAHESNPELKRRQTARRLTRCFSVLQLTKTSLRSAFAADHQHVMQAALPTAGRRLDLAVGAPEGVDTGQSVALTDDGQRSGRQRPTAFLAIACARKRAGGGVRDEQSFRFDCTDVCAYTSL
jgi:hypothetical protein